MKRKALQEILYFLVGFVCGFLVFILLIQNYKILYKKENKLNISPEYEANALKLSNDSYEQELADWLEKEVRILCWVFTHPENHKLKVPHVKRTWGNKCTKLLFMSVEVDPDNPDVIALPIENGRAHLWNKTKLTMKYVYENHINDADWFMRADDDNFILMENLRYMLYQYHPQTSLYLGCRFAIKYSGTEDGYMAGGGHIFSKKALQKFNEISLKNSTFCPENDSELDDVFVGNCLNHYAIFLDGRDEVGQKRFFPLSPEEHFKPELDPSFWYAQYLWRNVTGGGIGCCSDTFVSKHYTSPQELYMLEYLIYRVHPFGLQKNLTETLPRKFSLEEIIAVSDKKSFAPNYVEHNRTHNIENDERYKK